VTVLRDRVAGSAFAAAIKAAAIVAFCSALLGGCGAEAPTVESANAPEENTAAAPPARAPRGERLVFVPPPDWSRYDEHVEPSLRKVEYRPGSPLAGSTERLWIESHADEPLPSPLEGLANVAALARASCPDFEHFNTSIGNDNGYPSAMAVLVCRDDPDSPGARISMVKAIKGSERFYVVARSRTVPPLAGPRGDDDSSGEQVRQELTEVLAGFALYLRGVSVCDDRSADRHPCAEVEI
jgi:hypothetical protein